jgi:hypothetical protein
MRAKIQKKIIKMIKIITLIPASVIYLLIAGCNSGDSKDGPPDVNPDVNISGVPEGGSDDPLKQLQDEGKLPTTGTGPKTTPLTGLGTEGLSVYPPSVDPDQDNVPNGAIGGHPEIPVDNCPNVSNPGQADTDYDGLGDACDS